MLETASPEKIAALRVAQGSEVNQVRLANLAQGTLIRATTRSGNAYLFEIADPEIPRTHVVRCEARPLATETGYIDEVTVSEVFRVGEPIDVGGGTTSRVTVLCILS